MNSYHDYNIYKYEVDSSNQEIKMCLREHHGSHEVQLVFSGVVGHLLEHALGGNIILEFCEDDVEVFYESASNELKRYQKYGLPLDASTKERFVNDMSAKKLKCFSLSTSYGLSGWVLAVSVGENA